MAKKKQKVLGTGVESMDGVVKSIELRDDSDFGSVSIRHGPKPKKDKEGMTIGPYPRMTHLDLPKADVAGMKVGEKVTVRVDRKAADSPRMVRS